MDLRFNLQTVNVVTVLSWLCWPLRKGRELESPTSRKQSYHTAPPNVTLYNPALLYEKQRKQSFSLFTYSDLAFWQTKRATTTGVTAQPATSSPRFQHHLFQKQWLSLCHILLWSTDELAFSQRDDVIETVTFYIGVPRNRNSEAAILFSDWQTELKFYK